MCKNCSNGCFGDLEDFRCAPIKVGPSFLAGNLLGSAGRSYPSCGRRNWRGSKLGAVEVGLVGHQCMTQVAVGFLREGVVVVRVMGGGMVEA